MEYCRCSRPNLWGTENSRFCIGCGLVAAPNTKDTRKRKAEEAEIVTHDNERVAPQPPSRTTFCYNKLSCASAFRLLRLFPGSYEDDIACEIFHSDISDPPDYEAVSYTWGNTGLTKELQTTAGLIKITNNCLSVLRGLRDAKWDRFLWVDAICICQTDNEEKNHQIPLMARIYASATQVLIYLGDHTTMSDTEDLFGLLGGTRKRNPRLDYEKSMCEFLSLPWFSRVWVLQEVAMADHAKIIIGSTVLDWRHLSIANIHALRLTATNRAGQVPSVLQISRAGKKPLKDPASLIKMARSCQSSDPRDRIYALLGLVDERSGINLGPDYTRTTREVYADVAIRLFKTDHCLDFLSDIGKYEACSRSTIEIAIRDTSFHLEDWTSQLRNINTNLKNLPERVPVPDSLPIPRSMFSWIMLESEMEIIRCRLDSVMEKARNFLHDVNINPINAIPSLTQYILDLFTGLGLELEKLSSDDIDAVWICQADRACKTWTDKLLAAEERLISEHEEVDKTVIEAYGTFLTSEHLFRPMPKERTNFEVIDENLNLPSWVPDYRHHPQLFSFTRWRPDVFSGQNIAHSNVCSQQHSTLALEIKAIFVDKVQSTDCRPGQLIPLSHTRLMFTEHLLSQPTQFAENFDQTLAGTGHGATIDDIRKFAQGRRLAITETSLAIVPATFKIGDVIVVARGGTVPYLLRPSTSSPDRFQFIGECYLHGIRGPQVAPNYTELLGWFKDHVMGQGEQDDLPWQTIFLE